MFYFAFLGVQVLMCVCVCMHACVCACVCACLSVCCVCVCMCMHACVRACLSVACVFVCVFVCVCVCMCVCVCACTYSRLYRPDFVLYKYFNYYSIYEVQSGRRKGQTAEHAVKQHRQIRTDSAYIIEESVLFHSAAYISAHPQWTHAHMFNRAAQAANKARSR